MTGYNRDDAMTFMRDRLKTADFKSLATHSESLLARALDLDFDYMRGSGVLDEDGGMGAAYYDDDDAFEFIYDRMSRERGMGEDDPLQGELAAFIDQYMDLQQEFLEKSGLMEWD